MYEAERAAAWYQTQLACQILARYQIESALEQFKDQLCELMDPEPTPRSKPAARPKLRRPRRITA
jgi:hypothetical protein